MTPAERGARDYLPDLFRYMTVTHGPDWTAESLGLMVIEDAAGWDIPVYPGPGVVLAEPFSAMKNREGAT